tara:strand:- start:41282 stop:41977 length:696 start_codon:yes stop_codon:yes gene_type:complete
MPNKQTLGVIVPFYNEENFLEESILRLIEVKIINQIILVDDCSNDKSFDIANDLSKRFNHIEVLKNSENTGKGGAVRHGLNSIKTEYVFIHDADLEYFPFDVKEMYQLIQKEPNSLVLGSRTIGDKKRKNIYFWTYFGNKLFSSFFSFLNNYKISDIASCYWLIKSDTLRALDLQENEFEIEVEVLSKFLKLNHKIHEVPISYEARTYRNGKKIKFKDAVSIFLKILKYRK